MLYMAKGFLILIPLKKVLNIKFRKWHKAPEPFDEFLTDVKFALYHTDRLALWKNRCLVQCISGKWMLQKRGFEPLISFGVKKRPSGKLIAHAWMVVDFVEIIPSGDSFIELK